MNASDATRTVVDRKTAMMTPDPSRNIQWAPAGALEQELQVMLARNWISERTISDCQNRWHCTRNEAAARLLGKTQVAADVAE